METVRRLRSRRVLPALLAVLLAFAGGPGCAHSRASRTAGAEQSNAPSVTANEASTPPAAAEGEYGPEPVARVRPIVLVLGPGFARGFAHAGVLLALREQGIPIAAIVGTETGALIGALFALSESVNKFDWALLRLKPEVFFEPPGLLSAITGGESDGAALEAALRQTVGDRPLEAGRPRVGVMIEAGGPKLLEAGRADAALRGALANAGVIRPWAAGEERWVAATESRAYPVAEGRRLAPDAAVVVVDALGESDPAPREGRDEATREALRRLYRSARQAGAGDLAAADLVLRPAVSDIDYLDFARRTEITYRGRRAAQKEATRLRALAGLPPAGAQGAKP